MNERNLLVDLFLKVVMLNVDGQHGSTFILHCLIMMSVRVGLFIIIMGFFFVTLRGIKSLTYHNPNLISTLPHHMG